MFDPFQQKQKTKIHIGL